MIIEIEIAGKSLTERKRSWVRGGIAGRTDEPDRVEYKAYIKLLAQEAMAGSAPLQGPLIVETVYYRVKPASWPKNASKGNPWPFWPWRKPDLDNLGKIIWDAVTGIVWVDDAQVVHETNMKPFSHVERVNFRVKTIDEVDDPTLAWFLAGQHSLEKDEVPVQFTLEGRDTT